MIQIFATKMQSVRDALKNMKNVEIPCGPVEGGDEQKEADEIISIEWIDDDLNFNSGAVSPIDSMSFEGKENIRMRLDITTHSHTKSLRWCEVFLLESDEAPVMDDHLNYSKICEPIAKACGNALLPFLDLMAVNQLRKIGIRVTLGENVSANECFMQDDGNKKLSSTFLTPLVKRLHNFSETDVRFHYRARKFAVLL